MTAALDPDQIFPDSDCGQVISMSRALKKELKLHHKLTICPVLKRCCSSQCCNRSALLCSTLKLGCVYVKLSTSE